MVTNIASRAKESVEENISEIILESIYPGFIEYVKSVYNPFHKEEVSPCLVGTENLIEEVKELIKESEEEIFSKEQTKTKQIMIDATKNPLSKSLEDSIQEFLITNGMGVELNQPESKLSSWLNSGKVIIDEEIKYTENNLNSLYEQLAELNDFIDDEEVRLSNLNVLLTTIKA